MTPLLRTKMVMLATRLMAPRLGARAAQSAEDVVHDALVYHLSREPWNERRFVGAVYFKAMRALDVPEWIEIRNTADGSRGGKRRSRTTNVFPTQIFGCALADAFKEAA